MLVSHDRALLRSVCDEFWMVSRGGVEPFDGDLDDYQRYLLDEAKRLREELKDAGKTAAKTPAVVVAPASTPAINTKSLQRDLDKLDASVAALQLEKDGLEEQLAKSLPPAELAQAGKRLKQVNAEMAQLEERWMALSEQLESAGALAS